MYYILAVLIAFALSAFQYLYKRKALSLFILRFLTYLVLFILLINPKVKKQSEIVTKPSLYILADNTLSIKKQQSDKKLQKIVKQLKQASLNQKYQLHFFKFDSVLTPLDSLSFLGKQTNLSKTLNELNFISQGQAKSPVILLTDGQSNTGENYVYESRPFKNLNFYPVVLGDTTTYQDLKIDLVNVNSYAYKDNHFPVEIFLSATVNKPVHSNLTITEKGRVLFKKRLQFSPDNPAQRVLVKLTAKNKGLHHYKVAVTPLHQEKNRKNNVQNFTVEVIDNAKKILLVSDIIHPDLGAIKRSLKSHKYIQIDLLKPKKALADLQKYEAIILYQPNAAFNNLMLQLKKWRKPWLIITGKHTDWIFLNRQNLFFSKQPAGSFENFFPLKNEHFSLFELPDLKTDDLPPLIDFYGQIQLKSTTDIAYFSKVNGLPTKQPLMAFNEQPKQGAVFGENIWQWALQSGIQGQKAVFDQLLYQIVRYLSLQKDLDRLELTYKKRYYQGGQILINAKFLNENLEPDSKAMPELLILKPYKKIPMALHNDYYQADLSDLPAGNYTFTVSNKNGSLKQNGYFEILPFSLEAKNITANLKDLKTLAKQSKGHVYFPNQIKELFSFLKNTSIYPAIISYKTQTTPLIDYKWLLFLLVILLAVEWLLKKLRGEL